MMIPASYRTKRSPPPTTWELVEVSVPAEMGTELCEPA